MGFYLMRAIDGPELYPTSSLVRLPDTFLAFPAFLAGCDNHKFIARSGRCREKLGDYLGVNGRQKRILRDTADKS
jgi:hypothetical protein